MLRGFAILCFLLLFVVRTVTFAQGRGGEGAPLAPSFLGQEIKESL